MDDKKNKVICIGWHKTGTTTMGEALLLLNYKVVGARLDFAESLLEGDYTKVLKEAEKFEAFQDVPWAALYKELDAAFPGSKFILTIRDESKWIKSAVRHFGSRDILLHRWLYGNGMAAGNEELYLERYRRHNAEILQYFKNRPDDFLLLSLENGDGWNKLCAFLGVPLPSVKFPYANKARHNYTFREKVYAYFRDIMPVSLRVRILMFFGKKDKRNRFNNYYENKVK